MTSTWRCRQRERECHSVAPSRLVNDLFLEGRGQGAPRLHPLPLLLRHRLGVERRLRQVLRLGAPQHTPRRSRRHWSRAHTRLRARDGRLLFKQKVQLPNKLPINLNCVIDISDWSNWVEKDNFQLLITNY